MKLFSLAISLFVLAFSVNASATAFDFATGTPDFSMNSRYEKAAIAKDAAVQAYAKKLGAASFDVTNGKPAKLVYAVVTNNGFTFDVKVVYNDWPGIDGIVVYKNATRR